MTDVYINEKEAKDAGIRVVAYDFDGTLAEYDGWNNGVIGKPISKKLDELVKESNAGTFIIIFTTRLNERLWGSHDAMKEKEKIMRWLKKEGYLHYINLIVGDKPLADEYHDDRAIPC